MKLPRLTLLTASVLLASCASAPDGSGTIAQLRRVQPELADANIEGGIEKAMAGYQKFLEETPDSAMTPEAIRRLADLKIEKEYGVLESRTRTAPVSMALTAPLLAPSASAPAAPVAPPVAGADKESQKDFEARATQAATVAASADAAPVPGEVAADLENAGAREAIALYKQLLEKYPLYERNDQVLYQMSRAYEELGNADEAMGVMNRIVTEFPQSRYVDEIQFRRGEYYFTRRKFMDAEKAYMAIVKSGENSFYYELALYKLGWTFYKQEMHEEALDQFVALLDYKVKTGYDFENSKDEFERKRVEDTHRVISLSFSSLGGADAVESYFDRKGKRSYEVDIYRNLGEHYLEKRRYADAAASYKTFVRRNTFHRLAPHFDMRVIEIYKLGGFPQLVIDANKAFATNYGLKSAYWTHFDVNAYPDVLALLKTNLKELANYYHTLYQDKTLDKKKAENFQEASHWYHEFLESFPKDAESPVMNYQYADLLLEHKVYAQAATEFERTAYDYPAHEKSAAAGYAAVYAHREELARTGEARQSEVKRLVIRSSLRFAETFPQHEKAALVMGAALEDIYSLKEYAMAVETGQKLIARFPEAPPALRRSTWLVVAHSSFELARYPDAEVAYQNVLQLTAADDASRPELVENLAASIYKQGELANQASDFQAAAAHFLRVGEAAPTSRIRPNADYDAATALIQLKNWEQAAIVLNAFRKNHPKHELQADVTKKMAFVYSESGQLLLAAAEFERIETESKDESVRREALQTAASLYIKALAADKALAVYRRYLGFFPRPLEPAVETHNRIATLLKERKDESGYLKELRLIVDADAKGGKERTPRTRYLGATAALTLTEPTYTQFAAIRLTQPFDKSLKKKKAAMKTVNEAFGKLVDYEVGDVTAASTYYIAEAYFNFSESLKQSERPGGMDELEKEQYEEALDEQSYPFEEKAIKIHESNLNLIQRGVYNSWIDKSLVRLATLMPGRYAKFEQSSGFVSGLAFNDYLQMVTPPKPVEVVVPAAPPAPEGATPDLAPVDAAPVQETTVVPGEGS